MAKACLVSLCFYLYTFSQLFLLFCISVRSKLSGRDKLKPLIIPGSMILQVMNSSDTKGTVPEKMSLCFKLILFSLPDNCLKHHWNVPVLLACMFPLLIVKHMCQYLSCPTKVSLYTSLVTDVTVMSAISLEQIPKQATLLTQQSSTIVLFSRFLSHSFSTLLQP